MSPTDWLKWLHSYTSGDVELRRFHNTDRSIPSRQIWTRSPEDVLAFVSKYDKGGFGTFFGVASRTNGRGKVDDCLDLPALWIDCDAHRPLDELKSCPIPPSAIVESGGGVHAYWKLSEPYDVSAVTHATKTGHPVMDALAGLKRVFNGDAAVVDIARVMRLPGTTNSKRDDHVMTEVIHQTGAEYDFDEIVEWLSWQRELVGEAVDPFLHILDVMGIKPPVDVEQMLDGMVYGENVHDVQLRVTASLKGQGIDDDQIVEKVLSATRLAVGQVGQSWDWKREASTVRDMVQGAEKKFGSPKVVDLDQAREKKAKPEKDDKTPPFVIAGRAALKMWKNPIISESPYLWTYKTGAWSLLDNSKLGRLRSIIQGMLERIGASPTPANKSAALSWIIDSPDLNRVEVPWDKKPIIVFRNGVYEINSGNVRKHAQDDYATRLIDCDFDPDGKCPTWLAFLETILEPDVIDVVQEWFGAAMIRGKRREVTKAMILQGEGNTGKTQISNVIQALLGNKTCAASVASLDADNHGFAQFIGKTGWIADDAIGQSETMNAEAFKVLVTGESKTINPKFKDAIETRFDFPVCLTCNHLPKIKDSSNAVYSRALVVHMSRVLHKDQAPREETSVTVIRDELSGVLLWALEGWRRLDTRGSYELPQVMKEQIVEFREKNAPVASWTRQCLAANKRRAVDNRDLRASLAGFYAETYGEDARVPSFKAMIDMIKRRYPDSESTFSEGRRRVRGVELNDLGLACRDTGTSLPRGIFPGSGFIPTEVNRVIRENPVSRKGCDANGGNQPEF